MMLPDHLSGPLVRQSLRATFKSLSRLQRRGVPASAAARLTALFPPGGALS